MSFNFPSSPAVNDVYPSTGTPLYKWNGQQWVMFSTAGSQIYVSDSPPTGTPDNSIWWESDTGNLYVKYNDGDSSQWVIATPTMPDTSNFVKKTGDTMTGALVVPSGATGTQVPRAQDVVKRAGDTMTGDLTPATNAGASLGSASLRWNTVYTSDLSLKNDKGDWTIVEGEDDLFLFNNKKKKVYKFALIEV